MVNCCIRFCHSCIKTYAIEYLGIVTLPPCYMLVTHKRVFLLCPGGACVLSEATWSVTESPYNDPAPSAATLNIESSVTYEASHDWTLHNWPSRRAYLLAKWFMCALRHSLAVYRGLWGTRSEVALIVTIVWTSIVPTAWKWTLWGCVCVQTAWMNECGAICFVSFNWFY